MCVAMPGTVVKLEGSVATVDFCGNTIRAEAGLVQVQPGDHVLVHAGCILQVLSQQDNDDLLELLADIEGL